MEPDEYIPIRILLAERPYVLKIPRREEEYVRHAAMLMQRKLQEIKNQYSVKDDQDALALVTLDVATDQARLSIRKNQSNEALERVVSNMEKLLNIA
ncbi:MAG: cell division protein ZapA [Bacteroidetes bacterium]|nr:cell division protein ZapA [Bacteroidota bacterium]